MMAGEHEQNGASGRSGIRAIPRGIWALGFVSLLMDVSSEMIHSLLPLFLVTQLGVGVLAVGVILAGAVLRGIHMGMTQGILAALVADMAPADTRGTAFGVFHMAGGLCLLLASIIAGALWQALGPGATFGVGAVAAGLCIPVILLLPRKG